MKRIVLYCLLLLIALSVSASSAVTYSVREWPGNADGQPGKINNLGQVLGGKIDESAQTMTIILWEPDYRISFMATGKIWSHAADLNNRGQILGRLDDKWFIRGADGSMTDLSTALPWGGNLVALNDGEWVVGTKNVDAGRRAVVLIPGEGEVLLDPLAGDSATSAVDINNNGQVIGISSGDGNKYNHPFVWSHETGMVRLQIPEGCGWGWATSINDSGQIVGSVQDEERRGFYTLWNADGSLVRRDSAEAICINNRGQILLHWAFDQPGFVPYILNPDGSRHILNLLPGTWFGTAGAMNDNGVVLGTIDCANAPYGGPIVPVIWEPHETVAATVDITPDTLNRYAKGNYVTCLIELPDGRNLRDIDVPSLRLQGSVAPCIRRYQIGDADKDGVPDMMVKFDHAALCATLQPGLNTVTLTGEFSNGDLLTGQDSVRTVPRRK